MTSSIFIALSIICLQLEGAWMRYLPFRDACTGRERERLWRRLMLASLLMFLLYVGSFYRWGIVAATYKAVLILGWIPHQLVLMLSLRGRLLEHILVWSTYSLWGFILHSVSNVAVALFLMGREEELVLMVHSMLFSLWFLLTLPVARRCFLSLLPAFDFFKSPRVRLYTALLPFFLLLGFLVLIADSRLWHTPEERFSRILLPVGFFLAYHWLLKAARQLYEQQRLEQQSVIMAQEAAYLEEGKKLSEGTRKATQSQRENLLATYDTLTRLIEEDKTAEARQLIARQDEKLSAASLTPYTNYPIVNAALSIYLRRAEEAGLQVSQKVNLPPAMHTEENQLAVLLSNLLENALLSARQAEGGRISLVLQHNCAQCVLELINTAPRPLELGSDGLPMTNRKGHGLGMLSLRNFLSKYEGYADFSQARGEVTLSIYWEDKPC